MSPLKDTAIFSFDSTVSPDLLASVATDNTLFISYVGIDYQLEIMVSGYSKDRLTELKERFNGEWK